MARMGRVDARGLKEFQRKLGKIGQPQIDGFLEGCAKELAARLLRMSVKRTPVGQYSKKSGKNGGTLRRGWSVGGIRYFDGAYVIEVVNPVEYASYVEYGHRTVKKEGYGWKEGHFMMTLSEKELLGIAPKVLEGRLKKFLRGALS